MQITCWWPDGPRDDPCPIAHHGLDMTRGVWIATPSRTTDMAWSCTLHLILGMHSSSANPACTARLDALGRLAHYALLPISARYPDADCRPSGVPPRWSRPPARRPSRTKGMASSSIAGCHACFFQPVALVRRRRAEAAWPGVTVTRPNHDPCCPAIAPASAIYCLLFVPSIHVHGGSSNAHHLCACAAALIAARR